jgi:hypothetical protein
MDRSQKRSLRSQQKDCKCDSTNRHDSIIDVPLVRVPTTKDYLIVAIEPLFRQALLDACPAKPRDQSFIDLLLEAPSIGGLTQLKTT